MTKKKILIVEDDAPLCNILRDRLTREGFATREAKNGREGLELARSVHPDLILLDLLMPVMDGMTMLKQLRAESQWGKRVPVIILTNVAVADDERVKEIAETEPSYYLVKSDWKLEEVVKKIRERLGNL